MTFGIFLGFFLEFWVFFENVSFYLVLKKSDVLSWPTYQPTMSDFRPIIINLPTYLKSDAINGRSLKEISKNSEDDCINDSNNYNVTFQVQII